MNEIYIGGVLTAFRKSKGMSHVQMSRALGVNRQYLIDLENNKKPMKKPVMEKIERAFSITQADFFSLYISNFDKKTKTAFLHKRLMSSL